MLLMCIMCAVASVARIRCRNFRDKNKQAMMPWMAVKRGDPDKYRYTLSACRGSACNAIALFHHYHGLTSNRAMHLRILRSHEVQLFPGVESITLGYQVYKGPPSPSWVHALIFPFRLPRPASIDFPPLSVTTKIKMASPTTNWGLDIFRNCVETVSSMRDSASWIVA